jgi:hypothetical protein
MQGNSLLSGTTHKLESAPQDAKQPKQKKRHAKTDRSAREAKQLIVDQLTCPITHELFFDPIRAEPSQHYYERSQFLEWKKDPQHTDPKTRLPITGYTEPDLMFKSLMNGLFNAHPEMNKLRYFNLSSLKSALTNNDTKVIEKFISLFEISPERLETLGDQKEIAHYTAITMLLAYDKIALLKKFIKNISKEELNRIIPEGPVKGMSAACFLAGTPEGRELLKDNNLRDKISAEAFNTIISEGPDKGKSTALLLAITPEGRELLKDNNLRDKISDEALNAIIPEGPDKGTSAAYFLVGTTEGRELLKDNTLRDKISAEALNAIPPEGLNKGKSAACFLAATPAGRELLKDKNLRDKISAEALNAIIPEGPDKGKSTALFLAITPEGRELLKDNNLRDKISAEALNAILPEGLIKGTSTASWLINSEDGIAILLLDNGRLLKMISSNVLHQCHIGQTNETIASWLQNSEKGKSILKDYPTLWPKITHPPQRGALGLFDAAPVASQPPSGKDFKAAASHKKI